MLVPEEETPQEEDLDGDAIVEDKGSFRSDVGVSSTVVSPEPIPILAPVRASVCYQKAVKGHGTKDCPYNLDFAPPIRQLHGIPPKSHPDHWVRLSARNFYGFKFQLLTKSRFPRSLIPLVIEAPHLLFPFIFLLRTHQKTGQTRWITERD